MHIVLIFSHFGNSVQLSNILCLILLNEKEFSRHGQESGHLGHNCVKKTANESNSKERERETAWTSETRGFENFVFNGQNKTDGNGVRDRHKNRMYGQCLLRRPTCTNVFDISHAYNKVDKQNAFVN